MIWQFILGLYILFYVYLVAHIFFPDLGSMIRVQDKENREFSGLSSELFAIFIMTFLT